MPRLTKKQSKTAGLIPGTLVYVGDKKEEKIRITVMDYDEKQFQEKSLNNIEECFPFKDTDTVSWINIDGIHDVALMESLSKHFNIHSLVMEDILNTGQRPKYDDLENYLFVVLKMLMTDDKNEIIAEQVSLIVGKNFVISFQERKGDVFQAIRDRIRNAKGRIRKKGADYLAYTLIDAIVDNYFIIMEKMGETIEDMEDVLVKDPAPRTLQKIRNIKKDTIFLRKSVWPLREIIGRLEKEESGLIHASTYVYLRDLYDHTIQVIDTVETFRDIVSGMLDIYLSSISNRMNEVMKVLTIIATIFIPLTFIAGIYGMNFKNMPELDWNFGYPLVWFVMLTVFGGMVVYFKRKNWL